MAAMEVAAQLLDLIIDFVFFMINIRKDLMLLKLRKSMLAAKVMATAQQWQQ